MPTVRILPNHLVNQIAAGRRDRAAALGRQGFVENGLTPGPLARRSMSEGGVSLIEVSDDGCRMSAEDTRLAIERHAASRTPHRDVPSAIEQISLLGYVSLLRTTLDLADEDVKGHFRAT